MQRSYNTCNGFSSLSLRHCCMRVFLSHVMASLHLDALVLSGAQQSKVSVVSTRADRLLSMPGHLLTTGLVCSLTFALQCLQCMLTIHTCTP